MSKQRRTSTFTIQYKGIKKLNKNKNFKLFHPLKPYVCFTNKLITTINKNIVNLNHLLKTYFNAYHIKTLIKLFYYNQKFLHFIQQILFPKRESFKKN